MKATKKIVGAACALVAAVALSAGSTFAWFAMNDTVSATGMEVSASTASFLVITDNASNINAAATTNTIPMTSHNGTAKLMPTTHYVSGTHGSLDPAPASGLCHVSNPQNIDPDTGLGTSLTYEASVNPTGENVTSVYYVDFTVYIASKGSDVTAQDLKAEITNVTAQDGSVESIYNAVTVDYIVTLATQGATATYKASANIKGVKSGEDHSDAVKIADNITIPSASAASNNYITVTMRVYLDGALTYKNDNGTAEDTSDDFDVAYANNGALTAEKVGFSVDFTIANHSNS